MGTGGRSPPAGAAGAASAEELADLETDVLPALVPRATFGHPEQVLRVYVQHDNWHRPHWALSLEAPDPPAELLRYLGQVTDRLLAALDGMPTEVLHAPAPGLVLQP